KPIVIEQGKSVKERRRDLAKITKEHQVNPRSNYCFGEGGAGTYSDGKLYTRSTKRGNVLNMYAALVMHGAPSSILYEAHPHIGTNKLPGIVENMRESILKYGGEIHFDEQLSDLRQDQNELWLITDKNKYKAEAGILATGHSASNIYRLFHQKNWSLEPKDFAVGFRIEHQQAFIDQCQYKGQKSAKLPPAAYSLVTNVNDIGVFSFCMCPGGIVAPCATEPDQVVTNGWSPSKRNNKFANAGIVTQVSQKELKNWGFEGVLGGLEFQRSIEHKASQIANGTQRAPAQFAEDFLTGKISKNLPETSYLPGLVAADINTLFPKEVNDRLQKGLREFERKMPGFLKSKPIIIAPETRTSAPLRIPRNQTLSHPDVPQIFPCGEGAGFAGGIASAAIDGERCAEAAARLLGVEAGG
ncbi:MAG: NAD(P)/FAD-dependent oxidoreductase, partial [Luteibaculum sp.]